MLPAGPFERFHQAVEFVVVAVNPIKSAVQAMQAHDVVSELVEVVLACAGHRCLDRRHQPLGLPCQACQFVNAAGPIGHAGSPSGARWGLGLTMRCRMMKSSSLGGGSSGCSTHHRAMASALVSPISSSTIRLITRRGAST